MVIPELRVHIQNLTICDNAGLINLIILIYWKVKDVSLNVAAM